MNREIKFRAWDGSQMQYLKDEQFWLIGRSGYFEMQDHRAEYFDTIESDNGHKDLAILDNVSTRNAVLLQYTGLKDKNGVEIYEGDLIDILWSGGERTLNKVYWCDKWLIWCYTHLRTEPTGNPLGELLDCPPTGIEVIGNIYQNPELVAEPVNSQAIQGKDDTATASKK
jgi:hypothetical protein